MAIPAYFSSLRSIFKALPEFIKPNKAASITNRKSYEHPFSKEQGLELNSLRQGYASAEQITKADGKQDNNRKFIHAAIPNSALVSTMAAVADSSPDPKEKKPSIAFLKHLAQDFNKVIYPGDVLEVEAKLEHRDKNHRYVVAQIKRGTEIVGKAIADFAFLPKERMGIA